ncbi:MAG: DUF488 domain-containing protein [Smithellaceae bacterium]|jgi:uncharacterized protein YeaO (DUF488 family)|nr:DUF488 domain-containing protein [Smithellaceae bacterium]
MIKIKRIYGNPAKTDGFRILVDRLWPRGISKEKAKIDLWLKDIAPSDQLRKWFAHDPAKWEDFKRRYFYELGKKKDVITQIPKKSENDITFLYAAKDDKHNNAQALKEYLETK